MAFLIESSGSVPLVERVARASKNAYLPDLAHDPELAAWLRENGITAKEAARIQPTYGGRSSDDGPDAVRVLATAASLGTIAWNVVSKRDAEGRLSWTPGLAGIAVGGVSAAIGLNGIAGDESWTGVTFLAGGAAVIAGAIGVLRAANSRAVGIGTPPSRRRDFTPIIQPDRHGRTQLGLQLRH